MFKICVFAVAISGDGFWIFCVLDFKNYKNNNVVFDAMISRNASTRVVKK